MSKGQKLKIQEVDRKLQLLEDLQSSVARTMGEAASKSEVFQNINRHYFEQRKALADKIGRKK